MEEPLLPEDPPLQGRGAGMEEPLLQEDPLIQGRGVGIKEPLLLRNRRKKRSRSRAPSESNLQIALGRMKNKRMSMSKRLNLTGQKVEIYFMVILGIISILILYFSVGFGTGLFDSIEQAVNNTFNPQRPNRYERGKVPPIVHFVWTNQKHAGFSFIHALSIIAAAKNIEPEWIYLWFIREPKGIWWNLVLRHAPGVTLKVLPMSARNTGFKLGEHSKVIKLDKLIEHGGIYIDFNVLVLRPLDPLMEFTTVLGHEDRDALSEYFILATKDARFVRLWRQKYERLVRKAADITINNYDFQGQIAKVFPRLLYAEPDRVLRPFKSEMKVLQERTWDWRSFYAVNLWVEDLKLQKLTPEDIDCLETALGEIMRYILYGSEQLRKCETRSEEDEEDDMRVLVHRGIQS